ncbi:hypothetical protein [Clostridium sp. C8-1-8]|uniref:hypothetical protein n=1 Tax=Clostridium sp. C8-1-8 TaxID=2698831 RepID=UPI001370DE8E|nr:hypothetical protein [Clostridium sp. C8-1-8]
MEMLGEMLMRLKKGWFISIMETNNPFTVCLGQQGMILYELCNSRNLGENITEYVIGQFTTKEINLGWCCFYEFPSNIPQTMLYCRNNEFLRKRFEKFLESIKCN